MERPVHEVPQRLHPYVERRSRQSTERGAPASRFPSPLFDVIQEGLEWRRMQTWAVGFVVGALATPVLARRIRPALLMSWGLVLSSAGYFLLTQIGRGDDRLLLFAAATLILALGASPVFTLTNDVIIGSTFLLR